MYACPITAGRGLFVDFTANVTSDTAAVMLMLSPGNSTDGRIWISYMFSFIRGEEYSMSSVEGYDNDGFEVSKIGGGLDNGGGLNNLWVAYDSPAKYVLYGQGSYNYPSRDRTIIPLEPTFEYEDMKHVYFRSGFSPITITNIRLGTFPK